MIKDSLHSAISNALACWNSFWFKPISTKPLALFRIFLGLLLIQYALLLIPDLFVWLGHDGIVTSASVNSLQPFVRLNILNIIPDNDIWLVTVFATFVAAAILLTCGWMTRISSIVVFVCLMSFHSRNYLIINSGDTFMRLLCFWLIFSPAGMSFSLDKWLKDLKARRQGKAIDPDLKAEPWAQRLMQINMSLVYGQTFFKKIMGADWLNGTAVYFSSHFTEMHRLTIPYIFDHLWTCKLLTWATLGVEFSLCFLIWIKPIRYYVITLGIITHLIIDWTMLIPQFEWIMIATYSLFIEPADLTNLIIVLGGNNLDKLVKKPVAGK